MLFSDSKILKMVFVAVLCSLMGLHQNAIAQDNEMDIIQKAMDQAAKYESEIILPETDKAAESAAREAFDRYQSQEFQEKITSETERIKHTLFGPFSNPDRLEKPEETMCMDGLAGSEKIYLFISSSIPLSTLRTYVRNLDTLNDPNIVMVLRGFINGMQLVRPTLEFLERLLVKDKDCRLSDGKQCDVYQANIQIDPLVFRKFNIQQVPALAYVKNIKTIDAQQSMGKDGNLAEESEAVVVYGDVALDYALEQMFNETGNLQIKKAVQKLRGDFYER